MRRFLDTLDMEQGTWWLVQKSVAGCSYVVTKLNKHFVPILKYNDLNIFIIPWISLNSWSW